MGQRKMVTATALREVNEKRKENLFRCRNSFLGKWKTLEIQKVNHEKDEIQELDFTVIFALPAFFFLKSLKIKISPFFQEALSVVI
ncbi:hypothetical protein [Salinimicrobium sp. HB62]|uniref:hypothetical protein n=1 Tax=Salinimicrobium sp. HB62 TaxID=3077781 RepID=UPI002D791AEA|nr:hypothetical protein [Salinimicrobium sp. HB62]